MKWEAYNNKMEVICVRAGGVGALHLQPVTLHPADFHFMDQPAKWEHPWNQIHFGIQFFPGQVLSEKSCIPGHAKSLARRPGAIAFSSRATKMYHCPARQATLNTGLPQVFKTLNLVV